MSKKSTKSIKPAAPQVKPVKASAAPAPLKVAKPVTKTTAPKSKAPPAPKAVPMASIAPAAAAPAPLKMTPEVTIVAQIDVGFGNLLYVRGEGGDLSWTSGVAMECASDDKWTLSLPAKDVVVFKLLINDMTWSTGENYEVAPGKVIVVTPTF